MSRKFSERECLGCGASYAPTSGAQRYCKGGGCQKERANQRWKSWYEKQPRDKFNKAQKEYRLRTGLARHYELMSKYGISLDQWQSMVSYSGGCEVCGATENLCVDHDHVTSLVRGVLCRACNVSIGQLGDSSERLKKAYEYLRSSELGRNVPGSDSSVGTQEHLF